MILASWNVNSITARSEHLINWLKEHRPNVVCLQETKIIDDKFPRQIFSDMGYHCEFFGEKTYNGVAILSDRPLTEIKRGFVSAEEPQPRRLLEAKIDSTFILNAYIPNGSFVGSDKFIYKLKWLEQLKEHLENHHSPNEKLILCGDFNIAPHDLDVFNASAVVGHLMCSEIERTALEKIRQWGLIDAFRLCEQQPGQFTWWDYRAGAFRRNLGFRIDHIWITEPLVQNCMRSWIDKAPRKLERPSDHCPILIEIDEAL